MPQLDKRYRAGDLPPGSVVRASWRSEYVIGRTRLCMAWEQPIPGSDDWQVTYVGRLNEGDWLTPRQRAEVDEVRKPSITLNISQCGGDLTIEDFTRLAQLAAYANEQTGAGQDEQLQRIETRLDLALMELENRTGGGT